MYAQYCLHSGGTVDKLPSSEARFLNSEEMSRIIPPQLPGPAGRS